MDLAGKRVLVTGASRGIGEAMAQRFAAAGAIVAGVARNGEQLRALAAKTGGTAHPADLGDPEQVASLIERVEDEAGPIDVLVNNAGIDTTGALADVPSGDVQLLYQVNLITPAQLCRQVIPGMLQRKQGHIVNVSSLAGCAVYPGIATYASSKAGLTQLTAGLRADLRGLPIRTTVVELGPIPSDMLSHVNSYLPTARSFRRGYRLHLLVDIPREVVADHVVEAVEKGRRHVRLPRRAALFSYLPEAPRRMIEMINIGVPHQEKR
jgi:NAD(P)-dependent dehydrogenase (short-subunit alcohol dehydrogenase family)